MRCAKTRLPVPGSRAAIHLIYLFLKTSKYVIRRCGSMLLVAPTIWMQMYVSYVVKQPAQFIGLVSAPSNALPTIHTERSCLTWRYTKPYVKPANEAVPFNNSPVISCVNCLTQTRFVIGVTDMTSLPKLEQQYMVSISS